MDFSLHIVLHFPCYLMFAGILRFVLIAACIGVELSAMDTATVPSELPYVKQEIIDDDDDDDGLGLYFVCFLSLYVPVMLVVGSSRGVATVHYIKWLGFSPRYGEMQ